MRDSLFQVERQNMATLQSQIREMLVSAMLSGQIPAGAPIPSTRIMAKRLKVSRNTVMLAYQALASDGYLNARERSGFYVSEELQRGILENGEKPGKAVPTTPESSIEWESKFRVLPSRQRNIEKPLNWHEYPYPFIYGQGDPALFPIAAWRDCTRQAMNRKWLDAWTSDRINEDDPMFIEQVHQRILPRRGIMADRGEIIVTLGAQNALYLLASLLVKATDTVAVEDPGYPDIRNIFALKTDKLLYAPLDEEGIRIDALDGAKLVYTTPSHHYPTNVTMSVERQNELLDWAERNDSLIIEDDNEFETNYRGEPIPALKSRDRNGRVLYVGSLSKSMMPGLRVGFILAPREIVSELRALRRLMFRHPPGNNQRVAALFLALGHYDAMISRLHKAYYTRWETMARGLDAHFAEWARTPAFGGTSFWVEGPKRLDANRLARKALEDGIVIEPGEVFFADPAENRHYFRLGFSSIPDERIEPGLEGLRKIVDTMLD